MLGSRHSHSRFASGTLFQTTVQLRHRVARKMLAHNRSDLYSLLMGSVDYQQQEMLLLQGHAAEHLRQHYHGRYPTSGECQYRAAPFQRDFVARGREYGRELQEYRRWRAEHAKTVILPCPICLSVDDGAAFTWEHAPQQGRQSVFGEWQTGCWTCEECNCGSGRTFESQTQRTGIFRFTEDQTLIEAKTAFIIAFMTFGYWWASAPTLTPVREAIRQGNAAGLDGFASVTSWVEPSRSKPEVLLVRGEDGFAVVHNGTGVAVVLPNDVNPSPPAEPHRPLGRHFRADWPVLRQGGSRKVHTTCASGGLFHMDFCMKEPHWRPLDPAHAEVAS